MKKKSNKRTKKSITQSKRRKSKRNYKKKIY